MKQVKPFFTNAEGYIIESLETYQRLERGEQGNGCGAGLLSLLIAWLLQKIFEVDLSACCRIHDLGYKTNNKSDFDKIVKDAVLHMNIKTATPGSKIAQVLGRLFHTAVMWGGDKAYYGA